MFAFENWHSALEMKRYVTRFVHHLGGLPDFSALRFTRYNQYESMILPMVNYLEAHGVDFQFNTHVTDVRFSCDDAKTTTASWPRKFDWCEKRPGGHGRCRGLPVDGKRRHRRYGPRETIPLTETISSSSRPAAWWPIPPSAARISRSFRT